jgi:hypothetical protein
MSGNCDVTIIVVTSPSPSNPSLELLSQCIESCSLVDGLDGCPVIIMMDGYKISREDRTKVGRITESSAHRYEEYYEAIVEKFCELKFRVVRNQQHLGFALTVKAGLELCSTTYSLIAQYDRMFCARISNLDLLLRTMEENPHIRYLGFPTSTNINHDKIISTNYNLYCLNKPGVKLHLGEHVYLQPLAFWFDSQHICHVQRYLQIYRPYKNLPPHLRELIGIRSIKDMLLRPGDFIEDRFGQMQRRILWSLAVRGRVDPQTGTGSTASAESEAAGEGAFESTDETEAVGRSGAAVVGEECSDLESRDKHAALVLEMFRWYGSYLCWHNTSATPYDVHMGHDHSDTLVMVRHLRGRQLNSDGVAWKLGALTEAGASVGGYWKSRETSPLRRDTSGDADGKVAGGVQCEANEEVVGLFEDASAEEVCCSAGNLT